MTRRTNEQWIDALSGGPDHDEALADLRTLLVRGLRFALASRIRQDLDAIVEDFAQDALLKILEKLDTFRGESQFTTWANKVAVRVALTELRRQRWRDVSLDAMTMRDDQTQFTPDFLADPRPTPEMSANQRLLLQTLARLIREGLTERQQQAMTKLVIQGMPMEVVADEMNTNRNALYKLLHDARLRLKRALEEENLSAEDVLATFS
ncbi:MAG: sigma-70 family RNA polymerase sigma factor [Ardenticatenales bacterium]|nr:sigma-70 family RNA polymerase sigma factor [Ardenticatenales bacterium]